MKKYSVIYADPPWKYGNRKYQDGGRPVDSLASRYSVMTTDDICSLPVRTIACKDSALFLWTTDSHLPDALRVMESWGFTYRTVAFQWVKQYRTGSICYNFGYYTMKSVELCLLGLRGSMQRVSHNVKGLVLAERTSHSRKPNEIRQAIVSLFGDRPRIELFAREITAGWDVWGNEAKGAVKLWE